MHRIDSSLRISLARDQRQIARQRPHDAPFACGTWTTRRRASAWKSKLVADSTVVCAAGMLVGLQALDPWRAGLAAVLGSHPGRRFQLLARSALPRAVAHPVAAEGISGAIPARTLRQVGSPPHARLPTAGARFGALTPTDLAVGTRASGYSSGIPVSRLASSSACSSSTARMRLRRSLVVESLVPRYWMLSR